MQRSLFSHKYLPPLILACCLSAVYLRTLAPGLSWANDGNDGGDLIAAAATGGVAHPTGYPLYLLLARLFQFLPIGSLAFRTNLLSALTALLGSFLVYKIVSESHGSTALALTWPSGMAAGLAFGLAPLIWSQAVITEVNGLQALLVALLLYRYTIPKPQTIPTQKRLDSWRGLTLGLAMGNHVTTILLVPMAFLLGSISWRACGESLSELRQDWFRRVRFDRGAFTRQVGMFVAGLSLYLILPLRALTNPPVNWGKAVTMERFWWLVSGQLYQSYYLQFSPEGLLERIQAWAALMMEQFGLPGLALGLIGLTVFGKRSPLYIFTVWIAGMYTVFAVLYRSADSYVYLLPVFLCFAVWIGLGLAGLCYVLTRSVPWMTMILPLVLIGYVAVRSVTQVRQVDASSDVRAESFGREVLSSAPQDAILFARGDRAVFTLWYYHFAIGQRPDLAVIAEDLLHFDWYQENLRSTYPSLAVTGPFPWPETITLENPARPVCHVEYTDGSTMECRR